MAKVKNHLKTGKLFLHNLIEEEMILDRKNMDKKQEKFHSNLLGYSVVAIAALASGAKNANAVPVMVTPSSPLSYNLFDDSTSVNASIAIDLDNNSVDDVDINGTGFFFSKESYSFKNYISPLQNVNIVTSDGTCITDLCGAKLEFNDLINSALIASRGTDSTVSLGYQSLSLNGFDQGGNFPGNGNGFLGLDFDIAGQRHFGWINIDITADARVLTVNSWGYECEAETAIKAGDGAIGACGNNVSSVPEPSSLALLALGVAGLAAWRKSK